MLAVLVVVAQGKFKDVGASWSVSWNCHDAIHVIVANICSIRASDAVETLTDHIVLNIPDFAKDHRFDHG